MLGVVIFETAFLGHTTRLVISVIMSYPDSIQSKFVKATPQKRIDSLRDKSTPPIRNSDPISDLCLILFHLLRMHTSGKHYTAASDRFACLFKHDCIRFRSRKHGTDYFKAVIHRCMRRPSCGRSDCRILCIFKQSLCITVAPRTQNQS